MADPAAAAVSKPARATSPPCWPTAGNTSVGTDLGPPLAFWLADIAFRVAGNHIFGVYLLAQLCSIVTFSALYLLARAIVGGQQAVLAVLLTLTVAGIQFARRRVRSAGAGAPAVGAAAVAFLAIDRAGPPQRLVRVVDRGRLVAADDARGDRPLDPGGGVCARDRARPAHADCRSIRCLRCLVIVVLALPYLVWLIRADTLALPHWPAVAELSGRAVHWAGLLGGLVAGDVRHRAAGRARRRLVRPRRRRTRRSSIGRRSIRWPATLFTSSRSRPALGGSLIAGLFDLDRVVGGAGIALLMSGTGGDRRGRRSGSVAASAGAALGLGRRHRRACARRHRDGDFFAVDRRRRGGDVIARDRDRAVLWRQFRTADQPAAAGGGRRCAAGER